MTTWILACTELDPVNCTGTNSGWIDYYSFDPLGITAPDVLYVFSWGFGAVLFFWSIGYAAGVAIEAIRKA